MRTSIATLVVASLIAIFSAPVAVATPTLVHVRIEGRNQTLFEGPLLTEGRYLQASSDTSQRRCDGIDVNDPQNMTPGPTSTGASADAMELIGETFDGQWYPGYEDYFLTRWGPDREAEGMSWGVLVNNVFTSIGGCQYELSSGDESLWAYNAFQGRPSLALLPVSYRYTSGARPLTATAELGRPFEVEVLDYSDDHEDTPPASPQRAGASPFAGADVSPVATSSKGFEKVQTESPATERTGADGKASITFTDPGWHRIKATAVDGEGSETAIRSNRLDVCVPASGTESCPDPFPEDQPRAVTRTLQQIEAQAAAEREEAEREAAERAEAEAKRHSEEVKLAQEAEHRTPGPPTETLPSATSTGVTPVNLASVRVQMPVIEDLGGPHGAIGVNWKVSDPGVGIARWTVSSKALSRARRNSYVTRATGVGATSAVLALAPGSTYELQLTVTDILGRSSSIRFGKILVPADDRWNGLRYQGKWRHAALSKAWDETIAIGGRGARASTRLEAGRGVFLLRGSSTPAKAQVSWGAHQETFAIAPGDPGVLRRVATGARPKPGTVALKVIEGSVELDGVGVEP
jgi:hypothetical protein